MASTESEGGDGTTSKIDGATGMGSLRVTARMVREEKQDSKSSAWSSTAWIMLTL